MLINNKLKQWLCWESYGSNTERKNLKLDLDVLEKEVSVWKTKKKSKPLYEVWDIVTIKSWQIKEPKKLYEKLNIEWRFKWWMGNVELRVVGYKTTKSGKRYYMWMILAMYPNEYCTDIDTSPLLWLVTIFST